MRSIIGTYELAGRKGFLIQTDTHVLASDSAHGLALPAVLRLRDAVIGNGPTVGAGVFDFRYGPFTGGFPEAGVIHYHTYGEKILSVEIDLRQKRRRVAESLAGATIGDAAESVSRLCGNFAVAHSLAFARAVETAGAYLPDERTSRLRLAALEFERVYNHLSVIMKLASAAAQKVLHAHLAALFEETLRAAALLSGTRFMRGFVRPHHTCESGRIPEVIHRVASVRKEFDALYRRSLSSRNYMDRLHRTAVVTEQSAVESGLTGPSLRATGIACDLRSSEPYYDGLVPFTRPDGDALARMEVRADEVIDSCDRIESLLGPICAAGGSPDGEGPQTTGMPSIESPSGALPDGSAVGSAESPSGTVAWVVVLEDGRIADAYVSTPSVFGFQAYADAIMGNIFTDVPFAIDSFGVSFADAGR